MTAAKRGAVCALVLSFLALAACGTLPPPQPASGGSLNAARIGDVRGGLEVEITKTPLPPDAVTLDFPASVALADGGAKPSAARLYAYLEAIGKSDYVLFGHQNDAHHKRGAFYEGASDSDVKDITGFYSGVVGIDALSLIGDEYPGVLRGYPADQVEGSAQAVIRAAKEGAIITLSAHMPNFEQVRVKTRGGDPLRVHFRGSSYNVTTGDVMNRLLPGGDLNKYLAAYLDIIAQWAHLLDAEDIPVLFRPYHENMGSWFWWGGVHCTSETFQAVYRYTVEYLRDVKDVHNFLYVYSPDASFKSVESYESRYPGDGYVDVVAFDQYHDRARAVDSFIGYLRATVAIVDEVAQKHGKVAAVSETGLQVITVSGGITTSLADNRRPEWFTEVLDALSPTGMAYFLVWANFANGDYYVPYKTAPGRGVPMVDPFIDFYNDPRSVFAGDTAFYGIQTTPAVTRAVN